MNYKNTKELKKIFGIDITEKNRTIPYVILKNLYIQQKKEDYLKDGLNISNAIIKLAKELKMDSSSVFNSLNRFELYSKDKSLELLFKAFRTKEKAFIDLYIRKCKERKKQIQKDWRITQGIPEKKVKVKEINTTKVELNNKQLSEFLRANNIKKHELWNKQVKNISQNQWQQVKKINPKMFEEIVNN
jgi:hypothetical protein